MSSLTSVEPPDEVSPVRNDLPFRWQHPTGLILAAAVWASGDARSSGQRSRGCRSLSGHGWQAGRYPSRARRALIYFARQPPSTTIV